MTELEKQTRNALAHAEKMGWTEYVEFTKGFLRKQEAINKKERKCKK